MGAPICLLFASITDPGNIHSDWLDLVVLTFTFVHLYTCTFAVLTSICTVAIKYVSNQSLWLFLKTFERDGHGHGTPERSPREEGAQKEIMVKI